MTHSALLTDVATSSVDASLFERKTAKGINLLTFVDSNTIVRLLKLVRLDSPEPLLTCTLDEYSRC